jgi:uncharacterized membrane protein YgcG
MARTRCLPRRVAPKSGNCLLCGSLVSAATGATVTCTCNGYGLITETTSRGTVLPPPSAELQRRHDAPGIFHAVCFNQHKTAVQGHEQLECPRCKDAWAGTSSRGVAASSSSSSGSGSGGGGGGGSSSRTRSSGRTPSGAAKATGK